MTRHLALAVCVCTALIAALASTTHAMHVEKNMAYARFAGKRNQWREYCVLDSCGCGSRLEILLDEMTVELHQLMLLWVRRPAQPARVADPAEKLSTRAATQA